MRSAAESGFRPCPTLGMLLGLLLGVAGHAGAAAAGSATHIATPGKADAGLAAQAFAPSGWTTGVKRVLVIRMRYPDQPAVDPISLDQLAPAWQQARDQLPGYSHGMLDFERQLVVTPTVTLPKPTSDYVGKSWFEDLLNDARAAAAGSGAGYNPLYDSRFYDLDAIVENVSGVAASAGGVVGGKGIYVTGGNAKIQGLAHELGHNLGLSHGSSASHGSATFGPLKPDASLIEYGDNHDLMGNSGSTGGSPLFHFNPTQKLILGWIGQAQAPRISSNGTYRIYAHDQPGLTPQQVVALRIPHSAQEDVWYSFRQRWVDNPWSTNGVEMHLWNPYIHTYGGANPANTLRLDPRPATAAGIDDAALTVGRTFHDPYWDVFVTPIGKAGTQPEAIDLAVRFGTPVGNVAPGVTLAASALAAAVDADLSLAATASDADGDALAYAWDFGDGSVSSSNQAEVVHRWTAAGAYRVLCVVSDLHGGETYAALDLMIGAPSVGSISGRVLDENGAPLAGLHVHNGLNSVGNAGYRATRTLDDGRFVLGNLAAGSYTLGVGQGPRTFARVGGWSNPVAVVAGQDSGSRDWRRNAGLTLISGRVLAGAAGSPAAGVSVHITQSDAVQVTVLSDATGLWQRSVPQGITQISALVPAGSGWTTGEAYPAPGGAFPNPWLVEVGGSAISQLNFYFRTPDLPVVGFASAVSSVNEGNGEALIPISVLRSAGTRLNMTVKIGVGGSSDGFGVDHRMTGQAFTFAAIDPANPASNLIPQTHLLRVPIIDDREFEGDETLKLYLVIGQVTYAGGHLLHTLHLVDNEIAGQAFADGFEALP